jgi:NAD(P)-dependent dehydrogenase (short-subunit alcohol dehydrogenase family)
VVQLRDKVVVITGAGSGIGWATAVAFAEQGARVHGVDVRDDRLVELHRELDERELDFSGHVADVRDPEAMEGLATDVFEERGRVDVLFNNAGVVVGGPVQELTLEDWRLAVDVNLMGVIHGIHAFLPRMILQGGGGHIVNTASIAGLLAFPMVTPYTTTKFALVGLSEALDMELASHDIRVSGLCPGAVRTRVLDDSVLGLPAKGRELLDRWMRHFGLTAEDVAAEVLDDVRKRRGGVRTFGLGSKPLWLLRRTSVSAYERIMWEIGRRFL